MLRRSISLPILTFALAAAVPLAHQPVVVRTADPIARGLQLTDFPRTIKVTDNVYTYEDFHAGPERFTTTNMFVVTGAGVIVADGQGTPAQTKGLVDAIKNVTRKPITTVVIASDHGDHTGGNVSFPPGVHYIIHPHSKAMLDQSAEAAAKASREHGWTLPSSTRITRRWKRGNIARLNEGSIVGPLRRGHTGSPPPP